MKKFVILAFAVCAYCLSSAQATSNEIIALYNEATTALTTPGGNIGDAVKNYEKLISMGMDSEDNQVITVVENAKKNLPVGYLKLATGCAKANKIDEAIEFAKAGIDKAELYGNTQMKGKISGLISKLYQLKGGIAFNNKDYITAAQVFALGYAANPRNTDMGLNLAMSYCESGEFAKGVEVYNKIIAMNPEKYAEAIATAKEKKELYTNNEIAKLQQAGDNDGIIALAEQVEASEPALAAKIRVQAYNNKKDYDKVIETAEAAAAAQVTDEDKSSVYFILGAAYNAKYNAGGNKDEQLKNKAIANLSKVTAGTSVDAAKAALANLK